MDLWSVDGGPSAMHIFAFCYMWNLVQCSGVAWIYDQLKRSPSALGIFAFCYMWNWFIVVVLHWSMINWWGSICHAYICILLYVKLIWCSGVAWIYDQLGSPSALGIFAFCYMWNLVGVVVLHGSMINWGVHPALGIFAFCYMWNLFGVVVLHGSMINWGVVVVLHGSMVDWGQRGFVCTGICAFFYMWNIVSVVVFHRSVVNWRRGGVNLLWIYVHSGIYETYVV